MSILSLIGAAALADLLSHRTTEIMKEIIGRGLGL
jgi:hypothetical protein